VVHLPQISLELQQRHNTSHRRGDAFYCLVQRRDGCIVCPTAEKLTAPATLSAD
jgi:hypothetical protein